MHPILVSTWGGLQVNSQLSGYKNSAEPDTMCLVLGVVTECAVRSKKSGAQQNRNRELDKTINTLQRLNTLLTSQPLLNHNFLEMLKRGAVSELQIEALIPSSKKVNAVCMIKTWMTSVKEFCYRLLDCSESCDKRDEKLVDNVDMLCKVTNETLDKLSALAKKCPDSGQAPTKCSRAEQNCADCKQQAPLILRDIKRVVTVASRSLESLGLISLKSTVRSKSVAMFIWNNVTAEEHLQEAKKMISLCSQVNDLTSDLPQTRGISAGSTPKKAACKNGKCKKQRKKERRSKTKKTIDLQKLLHAR